MVERLKVYLVWDNSRAEHGEPPTLVEVYATLRTAEAVIDLTTGDDDEYRQCFSIEEREVRE